MWLYAAKCHTYSCYCFQVIKGKPVGGVAKLPLPPPYPSYTQVRVKENMSSVLQSLHRGL